MTLTTTKRVRVAGAAAIAFAVAACGGGGSSPPPPAPPPPGPPPPVVTAVAASSATSVQEGQPFTLNASGSSVSTGAGVTYAWTQVSGPAVTISNPTSASINVSVPELTADTTAQFQVSVTGSGVTAQATTTVTFANIAQTPVYNGGSQVLRTLSFDQPVRRIFGDQTWAMAGVSANAADPLTFLDVSALPSGELQATSSQQGPLASATQTRRVMQLPNAGTDKHFAILDEAANVFRVSTRTAAGLVQPRANSAFTVTAPCGFSHGSLNGGASFYVGTRTGFEVYGFNVLNTAPSRVAVMTNGRPACALVSPRLTLDGNEFPDTVLPSTGNNSFTPRFFDAVTLDTSNNTLNVYQYFTGFSQYQLSSSTPVSLNASKPLQLVAWTELASYGSIGINTGMALVFSDGTHAGEHRLVVVGFDSTHTLKQTTYNLGLGVPVQVFTENLDGDNANPEIAILKSTSPQVEIYESGSTTGGVTPLSGPFYLEVGLGATQAARSLLIGQAGMSVVFPEKKQIKVVGSLP